MITHVAIWHNDTIYALEKPYRHHNIFQLIKDKDYNGFEIQGFLDDQGNFLDRKQAFIHAVDHAQLIREFTSTYYRADELFSEDLW